MINYLDTRELYDRLNELTEKQYDFENADPEDEAEPLDEAEQAELESIQELANHVGELILRDGGPFIDEDDFEEYAEELARDCYDLPENWPCNCIDWEQAANELRADYSKADFDGTVYLYRA